MIQVLFAKAGVQLALGGLALAGAVLIPVSIVQFIEVRSLRGELTTLRDDVDNPEDGWIVRVDRAKTASLVCEGALSRQNQQVKAWQDTAGKNAALADKALADAKGQGAKLRQLAADILASQTVGDACKAAFTRNRENAR